MMRRLLAAGLLSLALNAAAGADMQLRNDVEPPATKQMMAAAQPKVAAHVGDEGNIAIYRLDGDYARGNSAPRLDLARRFYETHVDEFDFLVVFSAFEFPTGDALAFYTGVRNEVRGIGIEPFDNSAGYGSSGRLQGYIDMAALSRYDFNTRSPDYRSALDTLAHEILHRWSVRLRYHDAGGVPRQDLLGRDGAHWSLFAGTDASIMYGARWDQVAPGRWRIGEARQRLSTWDLYLAGFADASELAPIALIRSSDHDASDLPRVGLSAQGTLETVTPAQMLAAEGPRVPNALQAQRHFKAALLLLVRPGQAPDPADLARLERFRTAFEQYFQSITGGRATLSLHLQARTAHLPSAPPALAASAVSPRPQPVNAALHWLRERQHGNGRWEDRPGTAVRDTVGVLEALQEVAPQDPAIAAARAWLAARSSRNLDETGWLQFARSTQAVLPAALNGDGGHGLLASWDSSPADAAHALQARSRLAQPDAVTLTRLAGFLRSQQNADGSFAPTARGAGRVAVSAAVADRLLHRDDPADRAAGARARDWLATRLGEGIDAEHFSLAEIADLTLRAGSLDLTEATRTALAQYLLAQQGEAGDWGGSVHTTATAALALTRESRPNLVPLGAVASPQQPVRGESLRLRARVGNVGGQGAGASTLRWYDGDPAAGGVPLTDPLPVRELISGDEVVIDTWIETATLSGTREFFAVVDDGNAITEVREDDNTLRLPVTIGAAPDGVDLALDAREIEFTPASIERVPGSIVLRGVLRNLGNSAAGGVRVRAFDSQAPAGEFLNEIVLEAPAGSRTPFEIELQVDAPRTYRIRLVADDAGVIDEAREDNNTAEATLPFADSLDLEIGSVFAADTVVVGADAEIVVEVANTGTRDAPLTHVVLERRDGADWQALAEAALLVPAGQRAQRRLSWRPAAEGAHQLRLRVDPRGIVAESDETNNEALVAQQAVRADAPSLVVVPGSLVVAPVPVLQGAPMQVDIIVRNAGLQAAGAFQADLYRGDPRQGGVHLASVRLGGGLAPESETALRFDVADYLERGDATLFVFADSQGEIDEPNENDNFGIREITALGLPDLSVSVGAITLQPAAPVPGAPVTAQVLVTNLGEQPAGVATVRLQELGGSERTDIAPLAQSPVLAPGATQLLEWQWTFGSVAGARAVSVTIDADNLLREYDESNNEATLALDVQAGDAFVTERWFSPNGDGVRDRTRAVFAQGAGVEHVLVLDHAGRERRRLISFEDVGNGAIAAVWDGRDERGSILNDARYGLLAVGPAGRVQGPVYVTLDVDRPMALDAVNSANGVYRQLPASVRPWIEGPEGTLAGDYAWTVGDAGNASTRMQRGVIRSHALLGGIEPVLTAAWLERYAQQEGLLQVEVQQILLQPDGRVLIGLHEMGNANRTLIFMQRADQIDSPQFVVALDGHVQQPLQHSVDAQRVLVGFGPSGRGLLDLAQTPARVVQLRGTGPVFGVSSSGVIENRGDGRIHLTYQPFDPAGGEVEIRETYGLGLYRVQLLPGTPYLMRHVAQGECYSSDKDHDDSDEPHDVPDDEVVEIVDMRSGARTRVGSATTGFRPPRSCSRKGGSEQSVGDEAAAALRAFWLEQERELVVIDHATRIVRRFDVEGRTLAEHALPEGQRKGAYAAQHDGLGFSRVGGGGEALEEADLAERKRAGQICPATAHPDWIGRAQSRLGFELQSYDPDNAHLYLTSGEWIGLQYGPPWFVDSCEGAVDWLRVEAWTRTERLAGSTVWPLADATDAAAYPPLAYQPPAAATPPGWPRFIHRNGTLLRADGRVFMPYQGRTTTPWRFAARLAATNPSQTRLHLRRDELSANEDTGAFFNTLEKLTAVLTAGSDGRAVRLAGVATDRNFEYFQLDWAHVATPDAWNALMPPTRDEVRFDDFITWAPPLEGAYLFRLRVVDRAGNRVERFASAEVAFGSPVGNVRQDWRAISPNGDGVQDALTLDFVVFRPTAQRFEVRDAAGRVLRTQDFTFGAAELGARRWTWDGRDDQGARVPDGKYRVELSSGFVLRVNVDTVAPRLQADLRQPWDLYDAGDVVGSERAGPLVNLGPIVDYRVSEVFAGQPAALRLLALQSTPLTDTAWTRLEPFQQLEFEPDLRQSLLSAPQYAGRRFRVVAEDAAGNRAQDDAGDSVPAVLFVGAGAAGSRLPPIQSPPFGRSEAIPDYHTGTEGPTLIKIRADLPLTVLDLSGEPAAISVDELRVPASGNGAPVWTTLQRTPASPNNSEMRRHHFLSGRLYSTDVDFTDRVAGEQVALRLRTHYADGTERTSNATRLTMGGLRLECLVVDPIIAKYEAVSFLEEPARDFKLEVAKYAPTPQRPAEIIAVQQRSTDRSRPGIQFPPPPLAELRRIHNLPRGHRFSFRTTAVDGAGEFNASPWRDCEIDPEFSELDFDVRPVLAPECTATPTGRVQFFAADSQFVSYEHRVLVRGIGAAEPFVVPLGTLLHNITIEVDTAAWPEGRYVAQFERRLHSAPGAPERPWMVVMADRFTVDRQPPQATLIAPLAGERMCANSPAAVVEGHVTDLRDVGVRLEMRGEDGIQQLLECDGFGGRGNNICATPVQTGAVSDIFGDAPKAHTADIPPLERAGEQPLELRVRAFDWSGAQVCESAPVIYDGQARFLERAGPVAIPDGADPHFPAVAPASTGQFARARWYLRAGERVALSVELHAAELESRTARARIVGDAIASLRAGGEVVGDIDFEWDARADGNTVADGLYGLRFTAIDDCGNRATLDRFVTVDATPPALTLQAPADGAQLRAAALPVVGSVADEHLDDFELAVSTVSSSGPWIGLAGGDTAVPLPEVLAQWQPEGYVGQAWMRLSARDKVGNAAQVVNAFALLPRERVLQSARAEPLLFSPNDDGRLEESQLHLVLLRDARLQVRVLGANDAVVRTIATDLAAARGGHVVPWDGRTDANTVAPDGRYRIAVSATDAELPASIDTVELEVALDTVAPRLEELQPGQDYARCEQGASVEVEDERLAQTRATLRHGGIALSQSTTRASGHFFIAAFDDFAEGEYELEVQAEDRAGNRQQANRTFVLDCHAPELRLDLAEGAVVPRIDGRVVPLTGRAADTHFARYELALAPASEPSAFEPLHTSTTPVEDGELLAWRPAQSDGDWLLRLRVVDRAGNQTEETRQVRIDGTPPVAQLTVPSGDTWAAFFEAAGSALDANLESWRVEIADEASAQRGFWTQLFDGTHQVEGNTFGNTTLAGNGSMRVRLVVIDLAGLETTAETQFLLDTVPPPPLVLNGTLEQRSDVRLSWSAPAMDDVEDVRVFRNGAMLAQVEGDVPVWLDRDVPEGELVYHVVAVDEAGNTGENSNTVRFDVDRTPPDVALYAPSPNERVRAQFAVTGSATSADDDFAEWELSVIGPQGTETLRRSPAPMAGGTLHTWDTRSIASETPVRLRLAARDVAGNQASIEVAVVVDNEPPAAPTGLSAVEQSGAVQVAWDANVEADLLGYLLYRGGELVGHAGSLPADLRPLAIAANAFPDVEAPDGALTYRVYAIDRAGNLSQPSAPAALTRDAGPPELEIVRPQAGEAFEDALEIFAQSPDRDIAQVVFAWRAVGGGDWTTIGTPVTTLPWRATFDPGEAQPYGEYELRAVATDQGGAVDPLPPVVVVRYADLTPPAAPQGLVARADARNVQLAWSANAESDLAGYRIERRAWTGVWEALDAAPATGTTRIDADRAPGEHRYRVLAIDTSGNVSEPGEVDAALVFELRLETPYSPTAQAAIAVQGHALETGGELSWQVASGAQQAAGSAAAIDAYESFVIADVPLFVGDNAVAVRLRDARGNRSIPAEVSVLRGAVPQPPSGLQGTLAGAVVTLSWQPSPSPDVAGYRVFRNGRVLGVDARIPQALSAQSQQGAVPAVVDDDHGTSWPVSAPTFSPLLPAGTRVQVAWNDSSLISGLRLRFADADRSASDYRVLARNGTGAWMPLATRSARRAAEDLLFFGTPFPATEVAIEFLRAQAPGATVEVAEIEPLQRALVGATTYADTVGEGRHVYDVSAVSVLGFESLRSAPWIIQIGDAEAPPAVTLQGTVAGRRARLQWTASGAADLGGYALYRDGNRIATVPAGTTAYDDDNLANGNHVYSVSAEDLHYNESPRSNEVVLAVFEDVLAAPTIVSVQQDGAALALRVRWTAAPGPVPARYQLSVSTAPNDPQQPWQPLLELAVQEYVHAGLTLNQSYWYRVQAIDAGGQASAPSAAVRGEVRDASVPVRPVLTWPSRAGVLAEIDRARFDVCGIAAPDANVAIALNGLEAAQTRALAVDATQLLAFANRDDAELSPDGMLLFSSGIDGNGDVGWYDLQTQRVDVGRYGYFQNPRHLANGDVIALGRYGDDLVRLRRGDAQVVQLGEFGYIADFIPDRRGEQILMLLHRGDQLDAVLWSEGTEMDVELPAGRRHAGAGSIAWNETLGFLAADDTGRVYRLERDAGSFVAIGEGATAYGPVVSPVTAAWLAVDRVTARVLRYDEGAATPRLMLDDGRVPLAAAWSPDGRQLALRFADRLELRDAESGALSRTLLQSARDPGRRHRLQWTPGWRLLLVSAEGDPSAELTSIAGGFCARNLLAAPGSNVVEAVAHNASGLPGPVSEPVRVLLDEPEAGVDLVLDEDSLRYFPAVPALGATRVALVRVRAVYGQEANNLADVALHARLVLPDGSERVFEHDDREPLDFALDLGRLDLVGEYRLEVSVDPDQLIAESNENNNTVVTQWNVGPDAGPQLHAFAAQSSFAPGEPMAGWFEVFNAGGPFSGAVVLEARDAQDGRLAEIGRHAIAALPYGQLRSVDWNWTPPAGLLAGTYRVHATLTDAAGAHVAERAVDVQLEGEADLALRLQPLRTRATLGEALPVQLALAYLGGNQAFESGTLTLRIVGREPEVVLWSGASGALLPGYRVRRDVTLEPAAQRAGVNTLSLEFESGGTRRSVTRDVEFIAPGASEALSGRLALAPSPQLVLGADAGELRVELSNPGSTLLDDVPVRVRVFAEGESVVRVEDTWMLDLLPSAQATRTVALSVLPPRPSAYVARLEARLPGDSDWRGVATLGFQAVDGAAPVLVLVTPDATTPRPAPLPLVARITDRHSRVLDAHYRIDGGEWRPLAAGGLEGYEALLHGLADGPHQVSLRARDLWGNEARSESHGFIVDSTPPQILITGVAPGELRNSVATASIQIVDAHPGSYTAWLDGMVYTSGTSIGAGEHELEVRAVDAAGNRSERRIAFEIDLEAPALAIVSPSDGDTTIADMVSVRVASEAAAMLQLTAGAYAADAVAGPDGIAVFAAVPLQVGANRIAVLAEDAAGNRTGPVAVTLTRRVLDGELSGTLTPATHALPRGQDLDLQLRLDNQTPASYEALRVRLTVLAADSSVLHEEEFALALPGGGTQQLARTLAARAWPFGNATLVLQADAGEGWITLDDAIVAIVDTNAPQIVAMAPLAGSVLRHPVAFEAQAQDDRGVAAVEYRLDDGDWLALPATQGDRHGTVLEPGEGLHRVRYRASDAAGNAATTSEIAFTVDLTPPQIAVDGIAQGELYAHAVTPVATASDAHAVTLEVTLDGLPHVAGNPVESDGLHRFVVRAEDVAGNVAQRTIEFHIDRSAPLVSFVQPAADAIVASDRVLVLGRTEPGASVQLATGSFEATVSADAQGDFSVADVALELGQNVLSAVATDPAGNVGPVATRPVFRSAAGPAGLEGSVAALPANVPKGASFRVALQLRERAGVARAALPVRVEFRAAGQSAPLWTRERTMALAAGATQDGEENADSAGLELGAYVATLSAQHEGQWLELGSTAVNVVDGVAPVVAWLTPQAGGAHRGTVEIGVAVADESALESVQVRIDGGAWVTLATDGANWGGTLPLPREGTLLLEARARDVHGNTSAPVTRSIRSDDSAPQIAIGGVVDGQASRLALVPTVAVQDASAVTSTITLDGLTFVSGTAVSAEGAHLLVVRAEDEVGLVSMREVRFVIDTIAPEVTLVHPLDGTHVSSASIDVVGHTEALAQVRLTVGAVQRSAQAASDGSFVFAGVPLAHGDNAIVVRATDAAGNSGPAASVRVLRACGTVQLSCSIFRDGFEQQPAPPLVSNRMNAK